MPGYDFEPVDLSRSGPSKLTTGLIGGIAQTAISAYHSYQMDKIKYEMRKDALNFQRAAQAQERRRRAFIAAGNREKLKESLASERLAMDIEHMKSVSTVQNRAIAAGISSAPSVVRDLQRQQLRAELYQQRSHQNRMEQLKTSSVDAYRSSEVLYEPTQSTTAGGSLVQFGAEAMKVGKQVYGEFNQVID